MSNISGSVFTAAPSVFVSVTAVVLLAVMFNPFSLFSKYEIVDTQDFSCEGMTGFTFTYPIFKGWEPMLVRQVTAVDNECSVYLSHTSATMSGSADASAPHINVRKINRPGYPAPGSTALEYPPTLTLKNPEGIPYAGDMLNSFPGKPITEAIDSVTFFTENFAIEITLVGIDPSEKSFSRKEFFKTVIESFDVTRE